MQLKVNLLTATFVTILLNQTDPSATMLSLDSGQQLNKTKAGDFAMLSRPVTPFIIQIEDLFVELVHELAEKRANYEDGFDG